MASGSQSRLRRMQMFALIFWIDEKSTSVFSVDELPDGAKIDDEILVPYEKNKYKAKILQISEDKAWLNSLKVSSNGTIIPKTGKRATLCSNKTNNQRKKINRERVGKAIEAALISAQTADSDAQSVEDGNTRKIAKNVEHESKKKDDPTHETSSSQKNIYTSSANLSEDITKWMDAALPNGQSVDSDDTQSVEDASKIVETGRTHEQAYKERTRSKTASDHAKSSSQQAIRTRSRNFTERQVAKSIAGRGEKSEDSDDAQSDADPAIIAKKVSDLRRKLKTIRPLQYDSDRESSSSRQSKYARLDRLNEEEVAKRDENPFNHELSADSQASESEENYSRSKSPGSRGHDFEKHSRLDINTEHERAEKREIETSSRASDSRMNVIEKNLCNREVLRSLHQENSYKMDETEKKRRRVAEKSTLLGRNHENLGSRKEEIETLSHASDSRLEDIEKERGRESLDSIGSVYHSRRGNSSSRRRDITTSFQEGDSRMDGTEEHRRSESSSSRRSVRDYYRASSSLRLREIETLPREDDSRIRKTEKKRNRESENSPRQSRYSEDVDSRSRQPNIEISSHCSKIDENAKNQRREFEKSTRSTGNFGSASSTNREIKTLSHANGSGADNVEKKRDRESSYSDRSFCHPKRASFGLRNRDTDTSSFEDDSRMDKTDENRRRESPNRTQTMRDHQHASSSPRLRITDFPSHEDDFKINETGKKRRCEYEENTHLACNSDGVGSRSRPRVIEISSYRDSSRMGEVEKKGYQDYLYRGRPEYNLGRSSLSAGQRDVETPSHKDGSKLDETEKKSRRESPHCSRSVCDVGSASSSPRHREIETPPHEEDSRLRKTENKRHRESQNSPHSARNSGDVASRSRQRDIEILSHANGSRTDDIVKKRQRESRNSNYSANNAESASSTVQIKDDKTKNIGSETIAKVIKTALLSLKPTDSRASQSNSDTQTVTVEQLEPVIRQILMSMPSTSNQLGPSFSGQKGTENLDATFRSQIDRRQADSCDVSDMPRSGKTGRLHRSGQVEIKPGSGVFVKEKVLLDVKRFVKKPGEMIRRLLRYLVGPEQLKGMTALGRGSAKGNGNGQKLKRIPPEILQAVRYYVDRKGIYILDEPEFIRIINLQCGTLRNPHKRRGPPKDTLRNGEDTQEDRHVDRVSDDIPPDAKDLPQESSESD